MPAMEFFQYEWLEAMVLLQTAKNRFFKKFMFLAGNGKNLDLEVK